jgi:hypothetical protein
LKLPTAIDLFLTIDLTASVCGLVMIVATAEPVTAKRCK